MAANNWPNALSGGCPPEWATTWGRDEFGVFIGFTVGLEEQVLRWIGPGTFFMGSPESEEGRLDDEGPQSEVTLGQGFWLGETPVTQRLWEEVMGDNPSTFKGHDRPLENVSWRDCHSFFRRLNELLPGLAPRLPFEAEWEYACRAGSVGSRYGELDAIAWWSGNSDEQTHPVKKKLPNRWGLYDTLGNVWEWCADRAKKHSASQQYESKPVADDRQSRIAKGGSWLFSSRFARAASRYVFRPGLHDGTLGLRIAVPSW